MHKRYVKVRYIDRLLRLQRQLGIIRCSIEENDTEVAILLEQVERKLAYATRMINRDGPERDKALKATTVIEPNQMYENWLQIDRDLGVQ